MSAVREEDRPDVRELVARAVNSGHLEAREGKIGDVERVAALGRVWTFGAALWRLKYANDHRSYRFALGGLIRAGAREVGIRRSNASAMDLLRRAGVQALREWLLPNCWECGGAGSSFNADRMRLVSVCPVCNGTGARPWTQTARAGALRIDVSAFRNGPWERRLDALCAIIRRTDAEVGARVKRQLGIREPRR